MVRLKRLARAWVLPVALAGGVLASASHAESAPISTVLFDDVVVQGGALSYDGSGGALMGTSIAFDAVLGLGTAASAGSTLTCEGCTLNFTTGANVVATPSFWSFAPGGSMLLTGTAKNGASTIAAGALISGTFNDVTNVLAQGPLNVNLSASLDTTLDSALAAFYAAPTNGLAVVTQINVKDGAVDPATNAFRGISTDTDINYYTESAFYLVPIPAALPLFLTALGGIVMVAWRRHPNSAIRH